VPEDIFILRRTDRKQGDGSLNNQRKASTILLFRVERERFLSGSRNSVRLRRAMEQGTWSDQAIWVHKRMFHLIMLRKKNGQRAFDGLLPSEEQVHVSRGFSGEHVVKPRRTGLFVSMYRVLPGPRQFARRAIPVVILLHAMILGGWVPRNAESASPPQTQFFRIDALANDGKEECLNAWAPKAQYLSSTLSPARSEIVPLGFDEIEPAVKNRDIDFLICNSGAKL
jgi:hypothetical protein